MSVRMILAACAAFAVVAPVDAGVVEPASEVRAPAIASPIVYQGQLSYLDIPVTTTADLRFRLYDDAGVQLGDEVSVEGVDLDEGAFEAVLDFGVAASTGWIEVDVRSPSGDGEFTTLSPRQRMQTLAPIVGDGSALEGAAGGSLGSSDASGGGLLTLTPSASGPGSMPAPGTGSGGAGVGADPGQNAGEGGGQRADWVMSGANIVYTAGNVGIGLAAPTSRLHVRGAGANVAHFDNTATMGNGRGLFVEADANASRAIFARANRTVGQNYGVFAQSLSSRGTGVFGTASATAGVTFGVTGVSKAASGTGVRGLATNAGGTNFGIFGQVTSPTGWPGFFEGTDATLDQDVGIRDGLMLFRTDSTNNTLIQLKGHPSNPNFNGVIELGTLGSVGLVESPFALVLIMDSDDNAAGGSIEFREDSITGNELMRISAGEGAAVLGDGAFTANGIDYAESFRVAHEGLEPGDVVVMVRGDWENIERATTAYSDVLLGVVSTRPSFIAGQSFEAEHRAAIELGIDMARIPLEGQTAEEFYAPRQAAIDAQIARTTRPIALAGRVPVKVDASYGAIHAGDRLTSSATPGHAMVQTRPGPSLGIALEDFEAGTGTIQLLVQPGWTGLSDQQYDQLEMRNAELEARLDALEKLLLGGAP